MLFAQIIAFILVMVVFEAYQPGRPALGPWESYLASAALAALLWVGARLSVSMHLGRADSARRAPAARARRLVAQLHGAAILCLLLMITVADLKAHLMTWPLVGTWETARGLLAVGLYLLLLAVVWSAAHRLEHASGMGGLGRRDYLGGQVRMVAPVIFPWFAVSLCRDLLVHLWPGARAWLDSGLGGLAYLVVFVGALALFFPALVKRWWGCTPLPDGRVRSVCATVLEHTGVSVAGLLAWPLMGGRLLTAGVLGLAPRLRYLLITPALAEALDNDELAGVVAHEAGHVRLKHLWYYLMFFMGFFLAAYALAGPMSLLMSLLVWWLAGSAWGLEILSSEGAGGAMSILLALPLVVLLIVYLRLVMGFFMRHFERQADLFSLRVMGTADPLVGALERIASMSGDTRDAPSWHHFSIAQRVQALRRAEAQPQRIADQARLIAKGLKVFYIALALTIAGGLALDALGLEQRVKQSTVTRLVEQEIAAHPHDARLQMQLGALLFEQGRQRQGLARMEGALALAPGDPEVINGLAWCLATAKDPKLRDPRRALALARQAVTLSPSAHIWDTLAEAYFVNGDPRRAVAAARAALAANPPNRREYYQAQLRRFQQSLKREKP
ncbi:MAG: M48 family metalloprotease [Desulfarculaceae bacterium]|nr:M48 family metalloprotease [Desulfarculaceae bacterium]MCF8072533.1 M48 family metalloprotease [Desulfarculaceae bacterium]MCF8103674.1 M48 family metalloprotease [Desulfarculaceae bacterium]MCF8117074.1 M48 family metalloprotease [Desulfarculaceae bacterium]